MRYLIPPGITGVVAVAVGLLSKHEVAALVALGVIAIALLCWLEALAIDWIWAKWFDPRARPMVLKATVAWLEGDEVRLLGRIRYPAVEKSAMRRLPTPPMTRPVPPSASPAAPEAMRHHAAAGRPSSTSLISSTD